MKIYSSTRVIFDNHMFKHMPKNLYKKSDRSVLGSHVVEGKVFVNLPSIADEYGMSLNTVYKRYSRGKRGDDLVPIEKRKSFKSNDNDFVLGEQEYAKILGLTRNGLCYRRRSGKMEGQYKKVGRNFYYLKPEKNTFKKFKIYIDGVGYNSYQDACRKNNLNYITFRKRIEWGWSVERAITTPSLKYNYTFQPGSGTARKVEVEGKKYRSIAEAARAYNLTPESVVASLKLGQTIEQALNLEKRNLFSTIIYKGKKYDNLRELASYLNFDFNRLRSRVQFQGLSIDEAIKLGDKPIKNSGRFNKTILYRDKDLSNSNSYLYFVKFILNDKARYKIGITTQNVKKRLYGEVKNHKVLNTLKDTLKSCYEIEQKIHKLFDSCKSKDLDNSFLDGYTEVFEFDQGQVNKINKIFDDLKK